MPPPQHNHRPWSPRTRLAVGFVALVFLMGGGAREDIFSLVVLRPLAVVVLVVSLIGLDHATLRPLRVAIGFGIAMAALALLHVVPLPPAIWHSLPGRELIEQIDRAAGIGEPWRPLTLAPPLGWNALFALSVPFAALFAAARLTPEGHVRVIRTLLWIGLAGIVLGIVQLAGPPHGPLYPYRVTNEGALVGLFSNRNHHAIFIATLAPVLAFLASLPANERGVLRVRLGLLGAAAVLLFTALLVIGSRTGLLVGFAGAIAAMALMRRPRIVHRSHRDRASEVAAAARLGRVRGLAIGVIALLAVLFVAFSDSPAIDRLFATGNAEDLRFRVWMPIIEMGWRYFPVGSGLGSFADVYRIHEPTELLHDTYLNHAHNDWLEVWLTAGLIGVGLLALATATWAIATVRVFRPQPNPSLATMLGRLGAIVIGLLALASVADYPLRTPSLACVFAFAVVWLAQGVARPLGENSTNA